MNEPSDEILGPLRNDGRGEHHLAEAVKELDELEVKVAELKAMVANGPPLECLAEQGRRVKESHVIPRTECLHCGKKLDRTFESRGDAKPIPGDVTLCIRCGGIMIFTEELGHRLPTEAERVTLALDPQVMQTQILIRGR